MNDSRSRGLGITLLVIALVLPACGGETESTNGNGRSGSRGGGGGGGTEGGEVGDGVDIPEDINTVEGPAQGSDEPSAPGAPPGGRDQSTGVTVPEGEGAAPPPRAQMSSDARDAYRRGVAAAASGDLNGAKTAFEEALREDGRAFKAAYGLGIVAERQGRDSDADAAYRRSLSIQGDYELAASALANLMVRQGRLPQALEYIQRLAERYVRNVGLQVKYADLLIQSRRHEDAIRIAKAALRRDERAVPAMVVLAKAYYHLGRYELALQILDQAKAIEATNAELHNLRGFVLLARDNRDGAIAAFTEAVTARPDYAEAHSNLGVLYLRGGNYARAVQELEAAQRLAPNWVNLYLNLGDAYRGAKAYKQSKQVLDVAVRMQPNLADAHFNMGVLFLQADAIEGMDKVQQLNSAVREFTRYRELMGPRLDREDPSTRYVEEANRAIKREETRRQREAARAQMEAERGARGADGGTGGEGESE